MDAPRPNRPLTIALYLNAALLAAIAVALMGRGRSPFESVAFGQQAPQAIAGGAGFYLMPAQFAPNSWGCYVMDVDAQTLIAYVYDQATPRTLRLVAARNFAFDRQLRSYNTLPKPEDMEQVVRLERDNARRPDDATTRPAVPEGDGSINGVINGEPSGATSGGAASGTPADPVPAPTPNE